MLSHEAGPIAYWTTFFTALANDSNVKPFVMFGNVSQQATWTPAANASAFGPLPLPCSFRIRLAVLRIPDGVIRSRRRRDYRIGIRWDSLK